MRLTTQSLVSISPSEPTHAGTELLNLGRCCLNRTVDGYKPATYGELIAEVYDGFYHAAPLSTQVDLLAELAGDGPVLELGIGTGRLALPLVERGIPVHGIDASEAMVAKLHAKSGGSDIPVSIDNFESFELDHRFSLVFVGFNTFFALLTQEAQIACFRAVAAHLGPTGLFLIEAFVPDLARFDRGQRTSATDMQVGSLILESSLHDASAQRVDSQHLVVRDGEPPRLFPVSLRYAWPAELDLMARLAGLELRDRWGDWDRGPFGSNASMHVSVWGRQA